MIREFVVAARFFGSKFLYIYIIQIRQAKRDYKHTNCVLSARASDGPSLSLSLSLSLSESLSQSESVPSKLARAEIVFINTVAVFFVFTSINAVSRNAIERI
jgi:uncharacterized membrane protein YjfL (UPF0719 family)